VSHNTTKQKLQWSLTLLYMQHLNKIVSENTIKERYKFLIMLPVSFVRVRSYVTTQKKN